MTVPFDDSFPDPDKFFEDIEKLKQGKTPQDGTVYQLTYKSDVEPTVLAAEGKVDKALFTKEQLDYLKVRYIELRAALEDLVKNGWTVVSLDITSNDGHTGSVLKLLNPKGSRTEYRYLRGDDVTNLIPDDLLTDVSKLHERYVRLL